MYTRDDPVDFRLLYRWGPKTTKRPPFYLFQVVIAVSMCWLFMNLFYVVEYEIPVRSIDYLNSMLWSLGQPSYFWVSAAILVLLIPLQQFGTHHIGFMFSSILLIWFISIPCVGVYNILAHFPAVFKAISPHYIFEYFIRNQKKGLVALGGVVLCITVPLTRLTTRGLYLIYACLDPAAFFLLSSVSWFHFWFLSY